ncbi:MAG: hypothetical protein WC989_06860 [Micavibrio sp.]
MLKFIFMCMGIVALSLLSISMQSVTGGLTETQQMISQRNMPEEPVQAIAAASEPAPWEVDDGEFFSPDRLNMIETAAGGEDDFGPAFTETAPKGLEDIPAAPIAPAPEISGGF